MKKNPFLLVFLTAAMLTGCAAQNPSAAEMPAEEDDLSVLGIETTEPAASMSSLPSVQSFTADVLGGGTFTQEDLAAADLTVINIWQTTCPPCIAEMPELGKLEESLPDNVRFLTWCLDAPGNPETADHILAESGFHGITLTQAQGDLLTMVYSVMYTPTTVFLDSEGNHVIAELIGSPQDAQAAYRASINEALRALGREALPAEAE